MIEIKLKYIIYKRVVDPATQNLWLRPDPKNVKIEEVM